MLPDDDEERYGEDSAVCPWCDYRHVDSWEFADDVDEHECHNCERLFSISRHTMITYNTRKVYKKGGDA